MSKEEREMFLTHMLERIKRLDDDGEKILVAVAEGMILGKRLEREKNGGTNESETVSA